MSCNLSRHVVTGRAVEPIEFRNLDVLPGIWDTNYDQVNSYQLPYMQSWRKASGRGHLIDRRKVGQKMRRKPSDAAKAWQNSSQVR